MGVSLNDTSMGKAREFFKINESVCITEITANDDHEVQSSVVVVISRVTIIFGQSKSAKQTNPK